MSIHAAKGLEFPIVCLADLGRVPPTISPALLVDGERVGLRLARLDGSEATPTMHYSELLDARRRAEAEEEERILYVAMTRARDLLLLSGAADFERWPAPRTGSLLAPAPIAWLAPALVEDLPARLAALESPIQVLPVNGAEGVSVRSLFHTPASAAALMPADPHAEFDPDAESRVDARGPAVHSPQPPPCSQPSVPHARLLPSSKKGFSPLPLSYTALSELERCGYRYYLERVLELPAHAEHGGGGLGARARGVLVHRLLQSIDFAAPPAEGEIERAARELSLQVSPSERRSLAELLRAACATALAGRLRGAGIRREHPFAFSLGPNHPLVTGVLDVLLAEPACTLVVDYKSDRVAAEEDLEALVQRDYGAQRLLYALAALRDGAPRVEVIHWFLARPEEWVCASFAAAEAPALERELLARAARVREAGFAVSPTPHRELCLTCPGRATLCSWSDAETLREQPTPARSVSEVSDGELFERLRSGDLRAREQLVERYLPLARQLARRYQRAEEPLEDLVQVASLGLLKAVDRFDRGARGRLLQLRRPHHPRRAQAPLPRSHLVGARPPRPPGAGAARRSRRHPALRRAAPLALGGRDRAGRGRLPRAGPRGARSGRCLPRGLARRPALRPGRGGGRRSPTASPTRSAASCAPSSAPRSSRCSPASPSASALVLRLRFGEDLTQAEIGERIGVSQMQVSRLIRQALARLRAGLDEARRTVMRVGASRKNHIAG